MDPNDDYFPLDLERDSGTIDLSTVTKWEPRGCEELIGQNLCSDACQPVRQPQRHFPYGTVTYTHGPGIDRPLLINRQSYSPDRRGNILVIPLTNWRGDIDRAADSQGGWLDCQGSTPTFGCIETEWPGERWWLNHRLRRMYDDGPTSWMGDLVYNKLDPSGQMYMRNRYYDPNTGRFTQEDPIGISGGLNLYGFADGDPANSSDPYGLCPPWTDCLAQGIANWGARRGGVLGGLALNTGAALNAVFEASGVNDAAAAGDAIGRGEFARGATMLALSIPIGRPAKAAKGAAPFRELPSSATFPIPVASQEINPASTFSRGRRHMDIQAEHPFLG